MRKYCTKWSTDIACRVRQAVRVPCIRDHARVPVHGRDEASDFRDTAMEARGVLYNPRESTMAV
jgi:hypothetical protein